MLSKNIKNAIAVILSGYAKRLLENQYDRIFETAAGKEIKRLDDHYRYGMELGLNFLNAFFEQHIVDNTPFKKFLKLVGTDAAPELSKRIINGKIKHENGHEHPHSVSKIHTFLNELKTWNENMEEKLNDKRK